MKNEFVKDWMTANPVTIHADASIPDAHALLKERKIRRLPVVNDDNKLLGIISLSDVYEAQPSDATTLSIYELNYLLSKLQVQKIMTREVRTLSADSTIADAAQMMLENKIGGIPIVDADNRVVGIITESDIFRMVVQTYTD